MVTVPKHSTPDELTLELDGPKVTAEKFLKGIGAFLGLINAVAKNLSGSPKSVKWIVSVSSGSQRIHFRPESFTQDLPSNKLPELLYTIRSGIVALETSPERPLHFDDTALRSARELASVLRDEEELELISISTNGQRVPVTSRTLANVDSLFRTAFTDWGSIEGTVQVVSKKGKPLIQIYDDVLDKYIKCQVGDDTLREMLEVFEQRVSVFGLIRYDSAGNIKRIEVERFKAFASPDTIPTFADVRGIFRSVD
ncbi:MAG: hypothetical protein V1792_22325 [Pseudomonadota bacterium]